MQRTREPPSWNRILSSIRSASRLRGTVTTYPETQSEPRLTSLSAKDRREEILQSARANGTSHSAQLHHEWLNTTGEVLNQMARDALPGMLGSSPFCSRIILRISRLDTRERDASEYVSLTPESEGPVRLVAKPLP